MKNSKAKIVKIIICSAIFAVVRFGFVNGGIMGVSESAARFLTVVEVVLVILIGWTLLSVTKSSAQSFADRLKDELLKTLAKIFKPLADKIREKFVRGRRFVKGSNESSRFRVNLNPNMIDNIKKRLSPREKLNLRRSKSNAETIRLLYIKLILTLIERRHGIKYSHTPSEIKDSLGNSDEERERDILFAAYEQARYGGADTPISDDIVQLCKNMEIK